MDRGVNVIDFIRSEQQQTLMHVRIMIDDKSEDINKISPARANDFGTLFSDDSKALFGIHSSNHVRERRHHIPKDSLFDDM
jgi:hypothetical protein